MVFTISPNFGSSKPRLKIFTSNQKNGSSPLLSKFNEDWEILETLPKVDRQRFINQRIAMLKAEQASGRKRKLLKPSRTSRLGIIG